MFMAPTMWKATRAPATGSMTDAWTWGDNSNSYGTSKTHTGKAFGTAAADRTIIAAICGIEGSDAFSTVTIGGITATNCYEHPLSQSNIAFFSAAVPTGTTGTVVISFATSQAAIGVSLYAVYGLGSIVPVTTAVSTVDPADSGSLNINNGIGIGLANPGHSGNMSHTWTGFTEDVDDYIYDVERKYSTAHVFHSGSVTATCNYSVSSSARHTIFGVWR